MSVEIKECTCVTPIKQVFCGHAVVEDEFSLIPGIPKPKKVKIEPIFDTFKVEIACCDLVVVCGIIRKKIFLSECHDEEPITHDFAFQAAIPVNINTTIPVRLCDLKVTGVEVCGGCYKLLCPSIEHCKTIYHKIKEKDVLAIEITYKMPYPTPHKD